MFTENHQYYILFYSIGRRKLNSFFNIFFFSKIYELYCTNNNSHSLKRISCILFNLDINFDISNYDINKTYCLYKRISEPLNMELIPSYTTIASTQKNNLGPPQKIIS